MADDNNYLNQGPEDYSDMANMLSKVIANALMKHENMLPAQIVSYDRVANTAIVHPLIKVIMTSNTYSRPNIGPIPVFAFGAGNFVINFPIKAGDIGWIVANDRDITAFEKSLSESEPASYRQHSFNDAVFFPDVVRNFTTTGEDGNMVIQSLDGTIKISLGANKIHLVHPMLLTIDAPNTQVNGNLTATGTITGQTDVIFATISGKNHLHDGQGTLVSQGRPVTGSTSKPHN